MKRMRLPALVGLLTLAASLLAACGDDNDSDNGATAAQPTPAAAEQAVRLSIGANGDLGSVLVGPNGHTLYVFAQDEAELSNCTGGCIENWPPLLVAQGMGPTADETVEGELGVFEGDDGGRQVIYNGAPLYFFAGDSAPNQTNGHGIGGVWFVAALGGAADAAGGGLYDY